jgi:hypothetical protein
MNIHWLNKLIRCSVVHHRNRRHEYNRDQLVEEETEIIGDEINVDDEQSRVKEMVVSLDHNKHEYIKLLRGFQYNN